MCRGPRTPARCAPWRRRSREAAKSGGSAHARGGARAGRSGPGSGRPGTRDTARLPPTGGPCLGEGREGGAYPAVWDPNPEGHDFAPEGPPSCISPPQHDHPGDAARATLLKTGCMLMGPVPGSTVQHKGPHWAVHYQGWGEGEAIAEPSDYSSLAPRSPCPEPLGFPTGWRITRILHPAGNLWAPAYWAPLPVIGRGALRLPDQPAVPTGAQLTPRQGPGDHRGWVG